VHGDGPTIYVLLLASRKAKRLERGGAPAWSPDGKRIAFVRDNSINVMNAADGSGVRKVTGRGFQPAWSPDGKKIAFVRMLGTNSEIFVVNVDGSGTKRLTHNPGPDANPDWQPLPKTLAYASATSVASRSAP
jgi:TolB protein